MTGARRELDMPDGKPFAAVAADETRFEVRLENCVVPPPKSIAEVAENEHEPKRPGETERIAERYAIFSEKREAHQPKLCMWLYMEKNDVENLLTITDRCEIRKIIEKKIGQEYPKGVGRLLAIELIYSVVRFCQKCNFNVAQSGTLLSIFYMTHRYFTSSFYTTCEKTYQHFKEYMLLHCFECPPDSMQLFNYKESTYVAKYFCSLYLRNLPLIRMLTLPNLGFYLNYEIEQEIALKETGKKGKSQTKNKKGGKKK